MFEYIVVGGGATGCVMARRLVDAGKSVCVIEAGRVNKRNSNSDEPGGFINLWGSSADWNLQTVPQDGMFGRQITINQGRMIGGSSAINAMMFVRCNQADYRLLRDRTKGAWTQKDVDHAFAGLENFRDGPAPGRTQSGLMDVRTCPDPFAYSPEFQAAAVELGYKGPDFDYNGPEQMNGAGPLQFNIGEDGRRHSAFRAYLEPVLGSPHLTVIGEAEAVEIVFSGQKAVGVKTRGPDDKITTHSCSKDVILALGALKTPELLLKSGIGPAQDLTDAGVKVVADLPAVGQNLQDHLQLPVIYRLKKEIGVPNLLTGNVLFVNLQGHGEAGTPDLQLNFAPSAPAPLRRLLPPLGGPVMIFLPIMIQPKSTGSVSIRKDGSIAIDPRYLSDASDVELMKKAVELARSMAKTKAFSELVGEEVLPGAGDVEGFIRGAASTLWHPAGTSSLGTDQRTSVVDANLAVHGVSGLRICDASVMPRANTGNNHVPAMIIAEIGAKKLLAA